MPNYEKQVFDNSEQVTGDGANTEGGVEITQNEQLKTMVFEKDGKEKNVECIEVDLNNPEFDKLFNEAPLFIKNAEVQARQVVEREEVVTALDATSSIAEPGDWIVTNPGGETYRVEDETFKNAYKPKENSEGIFVAQGVPVKALQVDKSIVFKAPWGTEQGVETGGYIVERQDNGERYGIEQKAFNETYEAV